MRLNSIPILFLLLLISSCSTYTALQSSIQDRNNLNNNCSVHKGKTSECWDLKIPVVTHSDYKLLEKDKKIDRRPEEDEGYYFIYMDKSVEIKKELPSLSYSKRSNIMPYGSFRDLFFKIKGYDVWVKPFEVGFSPTIGTGFQTSNFLLNANTHSGLSYNFMYHDSGTLHQPAFMLNLLDDTYKRDSYGLIQVSLGANLLLEYSIVNSLDFKLSTSRILYFADAVSAWSIHQTYSTGLSYLFRKANYSIDVYYSENQYQYFEVWDNWGVRTSIKFEY